MLDTASATLAGLVPTGKYIAWVVGLGGSMFLAGIGFALSTSDYANLPEEVLAIRAVTAQNVQDIRGLRAAADSARSDRIRILCLAALAAVNVPLPPAEVALRCP